MGKWPSIWCAGDLMPSRRFANHGTSSPFWDAFREPAMVFVNLETTLTDRVDRIEKAVWLKASPTLASDLVDAHIGVVTVANNHVMDYGPGGLEDTLAALDSVSIPFAGAGASIIDALRPAVVERSGISTAFLGFTASFAPGTAASPSCPGVASLYVRAQYGVDRRVLPEEPGMAPFVTTAVGGADLGRACEAVARAKGQANVVVVALHWGVCHGFLPPIQGWMATYQRPLAHELLDAGADAIIGHGPHVLHGVEIYDGKPIFYSLGNLLGHTLHDGSTDLPDDGPIYDLACMNDVETRMGGIAILRCGHEKIVGVDLRFLLLDETGDPHWFEGTSAEAARELVERRSAPFGTQATGSADGRSLSFCLQ
jgi:poly-gamma-glutamate synthesis protein (capsule biosynthesis protein)